MMSEFQTWHPLNMGNTAILLLNRPISPEFQGTILALWNNAALRVAVDGGTTQARLLLKQFPHFLLPDLISGDLDSADPDNITFYKDKGVKIIATPDQDETDFTKAIRVITTHIEESNKMVHRIVAVCSNGGRMDHTMANIETLFHAQNICPYPVFILSQESLTWLLTKGKHKIIIGPQFDDMHCGLIPIGEPCTSVTTTGLKWNLNKGRLCFGELVSTSNKYDGSDEVTIDTATPLLWTMELP